MDENHCIQNVLNGDRNAFRFLVDRHKDLAYTMAYRMTGNRADAEEIVHDAFVKAFTKLGSFRGDSSFSTWFYRIVYNTVISFLRNRKKEFLLTVNQPCDLISEERGFEDKEEQDIRKDAVRWAIKQLQPVDRTIVTLFYHDERSLKEIAEVIDMHEDNVKVRLFRARKIMKALLVKKYREIFNEISI